MKQMTKKAFIKLAKDCATGAESWAGSLRSDERTSWSAMWKAFSKTLILVLDSVEEDAIVSAADFTNLCRKIEAWKAATK